MKIPNWLKIVIGSITAFIIAIISYLTFRKITELKVIRKKWKKIKGDDSHIMIKKSDGKFYEIRTYTSSGKINPDNIIAVGISNEGEDNERYHFKSKHIPIDRHNVNGDSKQSMDI